MARHAKKEVHRTADAERERVLNRIRAQRSVAPPGVPGRELLQFAGTIPEESLQQMEQVIEEECERVDYEGW